MAWLCLCSVAPFMECGSEVVNFISSRPQTLILPGTLAINRLSRSVICRLDKQIVTYIYLKQLTHLNHNSVVYCVILCICAWIWNIMKYKFITVQKLFVYLCVCACVYSACLRVFVRLFGLSLLWTVISRQFPIWQGVGRYLHTFRVLPGRNIILRTMNAMISHPVILSWPMLAKTSSTSWIFVPANN